MTGEILITDLARLEKQRLEIVAIEAKMRAVLKAKLLEQKKRLEDLGVVEVPPPAPAPSAPPVPINANTSAPRPSAPPPSSANISIR